MTAVFDAYAEYYDLLYKDKDYAGEAQFVHECLCRHGVRSGKILELGCGTGKHAEQLTRLGYGVHGVDLSSAMVDAANARKPTDLGGQLEFALGDVRYVRVDKVFDAVISLFHVASYQTTNADLDAMFKTAAKHLKPGGVFMFDCWYGPAVLTERPAVRIKRMGNDVVNVMRIAEPLIHPNENVVDVNYTVLVTDCQDNRVAEIREQHRMRYLFAPELEMFLDASGFKAVAMIEWLTGQDIGIKTWSATVIALRQ